jgi:hypothetical protein
MCRAFTQFHRAMLSYGCSSGKNAAISYGLRLSQTSVQSPQKKSCLPGEIHFGFTAMYR